MTISGASTAGATSGAPVDKPLKTKVTISSPSPAGATSGAPANKPLNKKMTNSGPSPAGAASGAPADKPLNQSHAAMHTDCNAQGRQRNAIHAMHATSAHVSHA